MPDKNDTTTDVKTNEFLAFHLALLGFSLGIIVHNALVVHIYSKSHSLCLKVNNALIINLCCSDLFTGAVVIPFTIASSWLRGITNKAFTTFYFTAQIANDFGTVVIVLSLVAVWINRIISIFFPFRYEEVMANAKVKRRIIELWVLSFLVSILPVFWTYPALHDDSQSHHDFAYSTDRIYTLAVLFTFYFFPSIFMSVSLAIILAVILRLQRVHATGSSRRKILQREGVAILRILVMFMLFLVCWCPLMVVRTLVSFGYDFSHLSSSVFEMFVVLRCVTSIINPVIYVWSSKDFRKTLLSNKMIPSRLRKRFLKQECRCMTQSLSGLHNHARCMKATL